MTIRVVAGLVSLVVVGGCVNGSPSPIPVPAETSPAPTAPSPTVEPTAEPVVLVADISERPGRWEHVTAIPFGPGREELGLRFLQSELGETGGQFRSPASFAVDSDGSFWILDTVKARVAHFSSDGEYLGAVGGLVYRRGEPVAVDIAVSTGRMFVLEERGVRRWVRAGDLTNLSDRQVPTYRDHDLVVVDIFGSEGRLVGLVGGYVDQLGAGPNGFAELAIPGSGEARFIAGVPVGPSRWIDLRAPGDVELEVAFNSLQRNTVQPFRVRVMDSAISRTRELEAVVGPGIEAVIRDAVGIRVAVSAQRPGGEQVGGVWYLRVGTDGEPLVWERLPDRHVHGELQVRHLTAGPDGSVYQMLARSEGVEILRRP